MRKFIRRLKNSLFLKDQAGALLMASSFLSMSLFLVIPYTISIFKIVVGIYTVFCLILFVHYLSE
jgi:hypothetical protein